MLKSRIPSSWNFDSLTIPGLYWLMTADLDGSIRKDHF